MDYSCPITTTITACKRTFSVKCTWKYKNKRVKRKLRRTKYYTAYGNKGVYLTLAQLYKIQEDYSSIIPPNTINVYTEISVSYTYPTLYDDSILEFNLIEPFEQDIENFKQGLEESENMSQENRPPGAANPRARTTAPSVLFGTIKPRRFDDPQTSPKAIQPSRLGTHSEQGPDIQIESSGPKPLSPGALNEDGAKPQAQNLRGEGHLTGLARRDPQSLQVATLPAADIKAKAHAYAIELETNVCKVEWSKSTIDWPYPQLFDLFRNGFDDFKKKNFNEEVIANAKHFNLNDDILTPFQWKERAYAEGVKFGRKYAADRPTTGPQSAHQGAEVDQYHSADDPMGNLEEYFDRIELESRAARREQRAENLKTFGKCQCCVIS